MAAIGFNVLGAIFIERFPSIKYLAILAVAANLAFSGYHVGVEQKWWQGPSTCTSSSIKLGNLSPEEALAKLKEQLGKRKFVPCDQVSWRIFGIPATMWNTFYLAFLLIVFVICPPKRSPIFYKK